MRTLVQFLVLALKPALVAIVFSIGLRTTGRDLGRLWGQPRLLARSLLVMLVLQPLIAVLAARALELPAPVKFALVISAISPGAPPVANQIRKLGANLAFAQSLLVAVSVLAVITIPVSLAVLSAIFPADASLSPGEVARQIALVQIVPLAAGLLLRAATPQVAARIAPTIEAIAMAVFGVAMVLVLLAGIGELASFGPGSTLVLLAAAALAIGIGHAAGGPEPGTRTALALVNAIRFPGLPLLVAQVNFPGERVGRGVLAYLAAVILVAVPYLLRRRAATAESARAAARA